MLLTRDNQQRDILYLTDFPLAEESASKQPFSTFSHKQLQRHLDEASSFINRFAALQMLYGKDAEPLKHLPKTKFIERYNEDFKGKILPNTAKLGVDHVCYTYLSLQRPKEGDSDWTKSVVNKKSIPTGEEGSYFQCEWLKDTWVSETVWKELQDCLEQIRQVQPKLIVIGGKWALFFLATLLDGSESQLTTIARTKTTFKRKIFFGELNKYRASLLKPFDCLQLPECVVVPILNPAFHWAIPDKEFIIKKDYERVASVYRRLKDGESVESLLGQKQKLVILTDLEKLKSVLNKLYIIIKDAPIKVCFDVETRNGTIDCIGFAYKSDKGYTIPFTYLETRINEVEEQAWIEKTVDKKKQWILETIPAGNEITIDKNYWSLEEEASILHLLHEVMLHPNCLHVGQNYMYDCQMYYREWGLNIVATEDTLIKHHVLYNYMQKDLALLASMYVDSYTMWKGEIHGDNQTRWFYNSKDVVYTLAVDKVLTEILACEDPSLQQFYVFQQSQVCKHITTLMNRGVSVDNNLKETLKEEYTKLQQHARELLQWLVCDSEFNPDSVAQVKLLFKDLCDIKPIIDKKTKSETFGAKAMIVYLEDYPEWKTLLHLYLEYKRLGVFVRTFLSAKLSEDGKMRCSYNVAGTKTYRLASRKNIDGGGLNLANLPSGTRGGFKLEQCLQDYRNEESEDSLEDLVEDGIDEEDFKSVIDLQANFGRVKDIFSPDNSEWVIGDVDYSAIDLHFVVWEADCRYLKDIIKSGGDVYSVLAEQYYGYPVTKDSEARQVFKAVCHATNYLGMPTTIAAAAGLSVPAVKRVQEFYFSKCPEIKQWHLRLESQANKLGYITNVFGARSWVVDKQDPMWRNKMVAWQPQASAAILVNKAICRLEEAEKGRIKTILQVHDSAVILFRKDDITAIRRILEYFVIPIAYEDIMTIPADIKCSYVSYGTCGKAVAKELLAKADKYIEENPDWRSKL
jgi:DNA polymerase I-like protein with 3'-5' exonuclease and polymerase domains